MGAGLKYRFTSGQNGELKYQYEKNLTNGRILYDPQSFYARNLINQYMYVDTTSGNIVYPVTLGGILDHNDKQRTNRNLRGQLTFNQRWRRHPVIALAGAEASETNQDRDMHRLYGYDPETNTFLGHR